MNGVSVGRGGAQQQLSGVGRLGFLVPGIAHLRLGAARTGLLYLFVVAGLSTVQFGAPFFESPAKAALAVSLSFGLGWVVSVLATRSTVRLLREQSNARAGA